MEWIEVTSSDVDTAKSMALDQLGVREQDAELEVIAEPKTGLFGRVKSEARVRARIKPRSPRTQQRRSRGGSGNKSRSNSNSNSRGGSKSSPRNNRSRSNASSNDSQNRRNKPERKPDMTTEQDQLTVEELEEIVTPFLKGLLETLGKSGKVEVEEADGLIEVNVIGDDLGVLIGPRGTVLSSLYDVLSTAIHSQVRGRRYPRIRLDVGGYRSKRREALANFTQEVSSEVLSTGKEIVLEPMNAADRKIVHDTVGDIDGIATKSEGEDPLRRVVIMVAEDNQE